MLQIVNKLHMTKSVKCYISVLATILFVFLVYSCGPKNENETHLLDKTIVDYFAYAQDNSWWVFSDSNGNWIDSFFIEDYHDRKEIRSEYLLQNISFELRSSKYDNSCKTYVEDSNDSIYTFGITWASAHTFNYFSSFPAVSFSKDTFFTMFCDYCDIKMIPKIRSGDLVFYDVLKVWEFRDTFYFAPQKGLIRFYTDDTEFLLSNYKIYHDE